MAREKGWLTSGFFAALCGTTKETLRHYKDIGLLSPAHQRDNGYFYYDVEQFYDFSRQIATETSSSSYTQLGSLCRSQKITAL